MKTYLIDKYTDITTEEESEVFTCIEHAEAKDGALETEINTIKNLNNPELFIQSGNSGAMTVAIYIYQIRVYANGYKEEIGRIRSEICAMYSLLMHLKEIDEKNPDNLPW